MKSRISIFIAIVIVMISLCSCGNKQYELTYSERLETRNADSYFEQNDQDSLKQLCTSMASRNDDPEARENFFNYLIAKTDKIITNKEEDKYETTLDIIATCLELPLAQEPVVSRLRANYRAIDLRLTEKSQNYISGKWLRVDVATMSLTGTEIEISKNTQGGYHAIVCGLPEGKNTPYAMSDIKWTNIQFANNKKFFFSDLTARENSDSYHMGSHAVPVYSGAVGVIDNEKNIISVTYEKSDVSSELNQFWVKEGFEAECLTYLEEIAEMEESEQNSETAEQE